LRGCGNLIDILATGISSASDVYPKVTGIYIYIYLLGFGLWRLLFNKDTVARTVSASVAGGVSGQSAFPPRRIGG
jgi:hypothetical protein